MRRWPARGSAALFSEGKQDQGFSFPKVCSQCSGFSPPPYLIAALKDEETDALLMSEMPVRNRSILFSARKQNGGCSGTSFLPVNASLLLGYVIADATLSGSMALGFGGGGDSSSLQHFCQVSPVSSVPPSSTLPTLPTPLLLTLLV